MNLENHNQQMSDSDMIFTQISAGNFDDYKMAEAAVAMLYVPDKTISRAGIAHALDRLERHYAGAIAATKEPPA
jgi:hypothetical protein